MSGAYDDPPFEDTSWDDPDDADPDSLSDEDLERWYQRHETPRQTAVRHQREQRAEVEGRAKEQRQQERDTAKARRDSERADAQAKRDAAQREQQTGAARQAARSGIRSGIGRIGSTAWGGFKGLVTGQGGGTVAGTAAGFALYAIGINLLEGGPERAKQWFAAKFANRTPATPAAPRRRTVSAGGNKTSTGAQSDGTTGGGAILL